MDERMVIHTIIRRGVVVWRMVSLPIMSIVLSERIVILRLRLSTRMGSAWRVAELR